MKFEMKTAKLNDMLGKVQKGVGNNKLLPITSFVHLKLDKKALSITATDVNNYITVIDKDVVATKTGEVIVPADQLIKLVSKTTSDTIKFELKDDHIAVKGNGNYKVPLLNEKFPTYKFDAKAKAITVKTKELKAMFGINKSALAKDMSSPCLTGYYLGDMAITSDGVKMCLNQFKLLDSPILLTQEIATLINAITAEEVKVQHSEGKLLFTTDNVIVFGAELEGLDDYPDVSAILDFEYTSSCKLSTPAVSGILDRLNIFVSPYDKNGIKLNFTEDGLEFVSLNGGGSELLPYSESKDFEAFECSVNIALMGDQISSIQAGSFELFYGNEIALKMVDGTVNHILCTLGDEEEETSGESGDNGNE